MLLSVVIPTRNRADFLATALESVADQDLSPDQFEVLVVDNGSTDRTKDVVDKMRSRLTNLRYFFAAEPGLHVGRHRGLQEANSDLLVFGDDDIRAKPTWLSAILENFSDPKVSMVGGNNYPDFKGPVPSWLEKQWAVRSQGGKLLGQLSILSLPEGQRAISPMMIWGCNFSIRKQVLLDAGGFHPDAMPRERLQFRGDGETHVSRYVQEQGMTCIFDSDASVYHAVTPERMTFDYFRQRSFNQGVSDSYTALRAREGRSNLFAHSRVKLARALSGLLRMITSRNHDPELRQLEGLTRAGYAEGYDWHQQHYWNDAEVRAWVHRADYFE